MDEPMRLRVSELMAQIDALADANDLALVARAAAERMAFVHARVVRATVDEVGARVEIVGLGRELDGLSGAIVASMRKELRGKTHMVLVKLDAASVETLVKHPARFRKNLNDTTGEIPVSRSNRSFLAVQHTPNCRAD